MKKKWGKNPETKAKKGNPWSLFEDFKETVSFVK